MHVLARPNVAEGSGGGGALSSPHPPTPPTPPPPRPPPFPPPGMFLGGQAPTKNCLNWVQIIEINTFENCKISTNWRVITLTLSLITYIVKIGRSWCRYQNYMLTLQSRAMTWAGIRSNRRTHLAPCHCASFDPRIPVSLSQLTTKHWNFLFTDELRSKFNLVRFNCSV